MLSYLIAIGVVVILGAVVGFVWQERSSGKTSAGHVPLPKETAADLMTDSISAAPHVRSRGSGCRAAGRHRQLTSTATELDKAAETLHEVIELAEMTGRSDRTGKEDLS